VFSIPGAVRSDTNVGHDGCNLSLHFKCILPYHAWPSYLFILQMTLLSLFYMELQEMHCFVMMCVVFAENRLVYL